MNNNVSEISQAEKDKYCVLLLICGIWKVQQTSKCNKKGDSQIQRTNWWSPEGSGRERGAVRGRAHEVQSVMYENHLHRCTAWRIQPVFYKLHVTFKIVIHCFVRLWLILTSTILYFSFIWCWPCVFQDLSSPKRLNPRLWLWQRQVLTAGQSGNSPI